MFPLYSDFSFSTCPEVHHHWSKDETLQNVLIKKTMSRDRYTDICSRLHFNDNTMSDGSKIFKVAPVLNYLAHKFDANYNLGPHLTVDKSLLKFKGHLAFKHRAGHEIEVYRLCSSSEGVGYTSAFKVHVGKEILSSPQEVVLELTNKLNGLGHTLALNRNFSCPELFGRLHNNCFNVVGTVYSKRKWMPPALKNVGLRRGDVAARNCGNLNMVVWQDAQPVILLTTMHGSEMVEVRKKARDGKPVLKPKAIVDYNSWKLGVDTTDQLSTSGQCTSRKIKWYQKLFFYFVDIAMVNSFIAYKNLKNLSRHRNSFSDFRIDLVTETLEKYNTIKPRPSIKAAQLQPSTSARLCDDAHFPTDHPHRNCHVCYKNGKRKNTRYRCLDCRVSLCASPCWRKYHTVVNY